MEITRVGVPTTPGPSDWFTGSVYLDPIAAPAGSSRLSAASVHFTPGARTAWHRHPNGQTIFVVEGVGRVQRRGGPVEVEERRVERAQPIGAGHVSIVADREPPRGEKRWKPTGRR